MLTTQRTLSGLILLGLLNLSVPLGLAVGPSLPVIPQGSSVSGSLLSRTSDRGDWSVVKPGQTVKSQWFKTGADSEAVIAFAGDVHMRMSPNTVVHVESSSDASLRVDVPLGKVMTSVPDAGNTLVRVRTPKGSVASSNGSFTVKVDAKRVGLEVLDGNAKLSGDQDASVSPGLLAKAEQGNHGNHGQDRDEDRGPDDSNTRDDDHEGSSTMPIAVGTVGAGFLIALLLKGTSDSSTSGPGAPASL